MFSLTKIEKVFTIFMKLFNYSQCKLLTQYRLNSPENYCEISVLTPIAKIFEGLLSSKISKYFNRRKSFSNAQHGFRSDHSCETALSMIIVDLKGLIACNKMILSLSIDYKKAFDLVNPKLLFLNIFHFHIL